MLLKASDIKISYPKLKESDPNNIVPTTSTSFTMMFCDCLAYYHHAKKVYETKFLPIP